MLTNEELENIKLERTLQLVQQYRDGKRLSDDDMKSVSRWFAAQNPSIQKESATLPQGGATGPRSLNDKLAAVKAKALEVGLRADFWNPIVLVITPKEETPEEQAIMVKLNEPSQPPLTPAAAS